MENDRPTAIEITASPTSTPTASAANTAADLAHKRVIDSKASLFRRYAVTMRTTVTLDPDVERALRERMAREHVSFKRALNDAVRDSARDRGDIGTPFHTPVFDLGQPTTDLTKANSIAAGLDDEDIAKHLRA